MKFIKRKITDICIKKSRSSKRRAYLLKKYKEMKIGENCEIYPQVSFGSEPYLIEIGNNVRISKGVCITTHDGGVWVLRNLGMAEGADLFGKVIIGNNVHVGLNCIIMPGVTIGHNVIIGAGSIVTKDVESNSVVVGVPARKIKTVNEYYKKNEKNFFYTKEMNSTDKKEAILKSKNKFKQWGD